jgi:hypothetical protein
MKADELRELVHTMRELGVRKLRNGDIEIDLGPKPNDIDLQAMALNTLKRIQDETDAEYEERVKKEQAAIDEANLLWSSAN